MLDPDIVLREATAAAGPSLRFAAPRTSPAERRQPRNSASSCGPLISGAADWISLLDGEVFAIGALTQHSGRITTMDILLDPARLARLDLTVLDL